MAPKAKIPAPIDRPLSRAYLREFSGWSTAYPPGLSEPTSLRKMKNLLINRDGSVRIRPGLRYLSFDQVPTEEEAGTAIGRPIVGTHEVFFLNDGSKAYLFAVREVDGRVGFRVLTFAGGTTVHAITDPIVGFSVPQGVDVLKLKAETTYVKYVQIDNKIFALSNAGETVRMFYVGAEKYARIPEAINTPSWTVADKLTVVHPDGVWINGGDPVSFRRNQLLAPSFSSLAPWSSVTPNIGLTLASDVVQHGITSMKVETKFSRRNLVKRPLHSISAMATTGWQSSTNVDSISISGGYLRAAVGSGGAVRKAYTRHSDKIAVVAGTKVVSAISMPSLPVDSAFYAKMVFYDAGGANLGNAELPYFFDDLPRKKTAAFTVPPGATAAYLYVGLDILGTAARPFSFRDVTLQLEGEDTAMFSGFTGGDVSWEGAAGNSPSLEHSIRDVEIRHSKVSVVELGGEAASAYVHSAGHDSLAAAGLIWLDNDGAEISQQWSTVETVTTDTWERVFHTANAPALATHVQLAIKLKTMVKGQVRYIDAALLEPTSSLGQYFDGSTASTPDTTYSWTGAVGNSASEATTSALDVSVPGPEDKSVNTLISSTATLNEYNFGFFYTFSNEVGETAASQVTTVKAQRGWSSWFWESPNSAGEPSGTAVSDPKLSADQLVAILPEAVFDRAIDENATSWSLYMMTWSNQDNVPVEAVKVSEILLTPDSDYEVVGYAAVTPQQPSVTADTAILPTVKNRYNYSNPSSAAQGLVAADRMILVNDPAAAAVIKWTSNQQGDYTNFTASQGGGYKTLTSGNLYIPAVVKLWQNPQSADTLTILCLGIDGHSTSYYMAPATVTSQADTTQIMAFEETTATPGTTSPFGVEVFNNALYHPLDEQLMKSTASNYNINHKSLTDQIETEWAGLRDKQRIVSSQHDGRLYFIVTAAGSAQPAAGNWGNELWVYDGASENGNWSRFVTNAISLRKIELGGKVYMSVIAADGIYYLDPDYGLDDYVLPDGTVASRAIEWELETNTQGANRAHDAWAHLQQMELMLGNFVGAIEWGLRSHDQHGKPVNVKKIMRDLTPLDEENLTLPWDITDRLRVAKGVQEWFFYAHSVVTDGVVEPSRGQINSVQYRYAPISVNVGYEHGTVESFEYGRETAVYGGTATDAGVPQPYLDRSRA